MPLESCMILLDCSQYMRNGDYIPTRLEAQQDAANLLIGHTTNGHPESTVGVSANAHVLVSPTDDVGKIMRAVHDASLNDNDASDVVTAVSVASLALKHRRNKNGQQRIIVFCGTPVTAESKVLLKTGKQLKKNNIVLDVVCLGNLEDNEPKLQELVDAANGRSEERTCHLVTIPVGVLPSDVLASSPIISGGAFAAAAAAGAMQANVGGAGGGAADAFADFGGVDPNMDPELAMALRVSMEEERARQERLAAEQPSSNDADQNNAPDETKEEGEPEATDTAMETTDDGAPQLSEEEALLQQALAMSMNENDPDDDAMEEEEPIIHDPAFVAQVLQDLGDDVDVNDPEIQELLKKAAEEKKHPPKE